jgi:hypothetical protein
MMRGLSIHREIKRGILEDEIIFDVMTSYNSTRAMANAGMRRTAFPRGISTN